MNSRDKSALALALAIVGGIAAGMRCDASEWVDNSSQINPRPAAYTVKHIQKGYKVDGSTCVKIKCAVNYYSIETCVNLIASGIGKQPPYIVPPGEFGGPPKEPRDGEEPPYVR